MTVSRSSSVQTALVPRQEVLPAVRPLVSERQVIDSALAVPEPRGIPGLIERLRRDHRAVVSERNLIEALRGQQAMHIQARYETQLQMELGELVEDMRHRIATLQINNQKLEMDLAAYLSVEASKTRIQQWLNFATWLKSMNTMPAEQVDRMVAQFIDRELNTTITQLSTMGGIDGVRRLPQAG